MMRSVRLALRILLGLALGFAGVGHLSSSRAEFQAQVPIWLPLDPDIVVVASGFVEIALGLALIFSGKYAPQVGVLTAAFFIAIFPGNINQYIQGIDAFGLNTDEARFTRLFFQLPLVLWAMFATDAWRYLRRKR